MWITRTADEIRSDKRRNFFEKRDYIMEKMSDPLQRRPGRYLRVLAKPWWVDDNAIARIRWQARKLTEKTGVLHTVDHIYPICGKTFCGLTVPWNLQVMPHKLNMNKSNKIPEPFRFGLTYLMMP